MSSLTKVLTVAFKSGTSCVVAFFYVWKFVVFAQDLAVEVSQPHMAEAMHYASLPPSGTSSGVPLMARIHLKLGAWQWSMNSNLDEESMIQGLSFSLSVFRSDLLHASQNLM